MTLNVMFTDGTIQFVITHIFVIYNHSLNLTVLKRYVINSINLET